MATCKYCGREIEQLPGKRPREYCDEKIRACRQLAYVQRKKSEPDPAQTTYTKMMEELTALRIRVTDLEIEVDDQAATIARLREQLDVEKRYLQDTQRRRFKAFLKKQPSTPFIERFLSDQFYKPMDTRAHYEYRVRNNANEEELQQFTTLWKLMLLDSSF